MIRTLRQLFLFSVSGLIGFVVDVLVLYLLLGLAGHYIARIFSFLSAVVVTWLINRKFTFKNNISGRSAKSELLFYLCLMLFGGAFNLGVYAILVDRYDFISANPVLGVAAGSLAGLLINFATSRTVLYRITCAPPQVAGQE